MRTVTSRSFRPADAPAVAALLNLIDEHAGGHGGFTAAEVTAHVAGLVVDADADTRIVTDPGGALIAAGVTAPPPRDGFRADLLGGVHPGWRGRGIGRDLLGWQLARLGDLHRRLAPHAGWEAHVTTLVGDEDATRLFGRLGLTPVRFWLDMVARTEHAPPDRLPQTLRVTRFRPEHEKDLYSAHLEAFVDHWGYQRRDFDSWVGLTVGTESFRPELSLLGFIGGELAGYVLSYADAAPERLYIGQVGVRPAWRRRGLASGLLARVLSAAAKAGHTSAALGVDADSPTGAVGVYERVGFVVESRAVTYRRPLLAIGAQPSA